MDDDELFAEQIAEAIYHTLEEEQPPIEGLTSEQSEALRAKITRLEQKIRCAVQVKSISSKGRYLRVRLYCPYTEEHEAWFWYGGRWRLAENTATILQVKRTPREIQRRWDLGLQPWEKITEEDVWC